MKLIFTSCMDAQSDPVQTVWDRIRTDAPDVLLLLGDQIYMDLGDLGTPNAKPAVQTNAGLEAYATDMHARYAEQWGVPAFQCCIQSIRSRGASVHLTWDDHDYGWNNGHRQGAKDEKHAVPKRVYDVSRQLFEQFRQHLLRDFAQSSYPAFPPHCLTPLPPDALGVESAHTLTVDGQPIALCVLDTRWYRSSKKAAAPTLLGAQQAAALAQRISQPKGLLIMAGGTPIVHNFLFSNDGWASKRLGAPDYEPHFPEYAALVNGAQRPVLYLSGDVHRNIFGGTLAQAGSAQRSRVVQILASGAGKGLAPFSKTSGSYATLRLSSQSASSGSVAVQFQHFDERTAQWHTSQPCPNLAFTASAWVDEYPGQAYTDPPLTLDFSPMAYLSARQRLAPFSGLQRYTQPLTQNERLEPMPIYASGLPDYTWAAADPAEFSMQPLAAGAAVAPAQTMQLLRPQHWAQPTQDDFFAGGATLIAAAFARAQAAGKQSVVFYIHGVGKSASDALAQGYLLRQLYPACEPIVFTWPAGEGGSSGASGLNNLNTAQKNAAQIAAMLQTALLQFAAQAAKTPALRAVVLARSAGTVALNEAFLAHKKPMKQAFSSIHAVVLSSALLQKFRFFGSYGVVESLPLSCACWVTFNRNDRTLRFARWPSFFLGSILGLGEKLPEPRGNTIFLDFTQAQSVGALHDYLFIPITAAQAVHGALLAGSANVSQLAGLTDVSPERTDVLLVR